MGYSSVLDDRQAVVAEDAVAATGPHPGITG